MILGLHYIDIAILLLVGVGAWLGYKRGGIKEISNILGLVAALVLGVHLMEPVGLVVVASLNLSEHVIPLVGFISVFLIVLVVIAILGKVIEYILGSLRLGPVNHFMGGLIGGLKSALILSIGLMLLGHVNIPDQEVKEQSLIYTSVEYIAPSTWNYVSKMIPDAERLSTKVGGRFEDIVVRHLEDQVQKTAVDEEDQ